MEPPCLIMSLLCSFLDGGFIRIKFYYRNVFQSNRAFLFYRFVHPGLIRSNMYEFLAVY